MNAALAELFRHNLWANLCLLNTCAGLSDETLDASAPGTFGKARDTLYHLVEAEESYLRRLAQAQPEQAGSPDDAVPTIAELRERARRSGKGLIEVAERFQPGGTFHSAWDGEAHELPSVVLLIQVLYHATEHRSQVETILSQQGVEMPDLSGWTYWEEAMSR